jgi:hypothetical protein
MIDIAATLARLLGISLPAACEGKPLVETLVPNSTLPAVSIAGASQQVKSDSQKAQRTR